MEKRPVTGILTIESGLTSISKIVMEMKYLYEKHKQWDWKVKQVEQKKYLVEFPSKDARRELTRLKGFDFELSNARANVRETERTIEAFAELQEVWVRATGVPPLARSEKVIEKIAHLIGDPMEVDSISLNREAVRVKVLCRDPLKIGGTSEIFLNRVGYRITWNPEGVRQHHQDDPDDPKPAYRSRGRRGDDEEDSQDSHEADKGESKKEEEEKKDTQKREGDHGHKRHKNNEMVEEEEDSLGEGEKVDIPEYIPDISDEAEEVVLCSQGKEVQGINAGMISQVSGANVLEELGEDGNNIGGVTPVIQQENKAAEEENEISLKDRMEDDIRVLEMITGEVKGQELTSDGFISSGKKKKRKQKEKVVATRQSSRIARDGVPVALKAQQRTSVRNEISGKNKYAIFNTVDESVLVNIARDEGVDLGTSEGLQNQNIETIKARELAQSMIHTAKERLINEDPIERLPLTTEIEGCVFPTTEAAGIEPAKVGGDTKRKNTS